MTISMNCPGSFLVAFFRSIMLSMFVVQVSRKVATGVSEFIARTKKSKAPLSGGFSVSRQLSENCLSWNHNLSEYSIIPRVIAE
jgi:hypothetical protein